MGIDPYRESHGQMKASIFILLEKKCGILQMLVLISFKTTLQDRESLAFFFFAVEWTISSTSAVPAVVGPQLTR